MDCKAIYVGSLAYSAIKMIKRKTAVKILLLILLVLPLYASTNKVYCKLCGAEFDSEKKMSVSICGKSSNHKHIKYEGIVSSKYQCLWCGSKYNSLREMSNSYCSKNPNGKQHEVYEGSVKNKYICQLCGKKFSSLRDMSNNPCTKNSKQKQHIPEK